MSPTAHIRGKSTWRAALLACCAMLWFASRMSLAAAGAEPMVSATLNGSSGTVLYTGQAGVFTVEIAHSELWEETLDPIRLELADGTAWTNALKCIVSNSIGDAVIWPLWMRPATNQTITLDQQHVGRLFFLIAPQDTLTLAPGLYSVQFVLDTQTNAAPGAWSGVADSIRMDINVQAEPATLSDVQVAARALQLAQYYALREDYAAGLGALDLLLTTQPRSIEALRLKAALLQLKGNAAAALLVVDDALQIFIEDEPNSPEPPQALLDQMDTLTALSVSGPVKITAATILLGQLKIEWTGAENASYRVES
ncbi:MAG TPA: hypothetical protein VM680_20360, partial [Verrucomicrobiae bacterium]|nr:hypothetical protein [Verrucomicrobiae bacterium]